MRTIIIIIFTVMMAGTCKAQTFDFSCEPINTDGVYLLDANECDYAEGSIRFTIENGDFKLIELGNGEVWMDHANNPLFPLHMTLLLVANDEIKVAIKNPDVCQVTATKQ